MGDERLFVGHLPMDIQEDEIRMIFNTYGRTTDIHLMSVVQQQPGQDRCAFVTYESVESARVAMEVLNGVYKFREESAEAINVSVAFRRKDKGMGKGDRGQMAIPDRGYDRGPPDRGFDRGSFDRAPVYDRGLPPPRGGGYDRGFERGGRGMMDRGGFDRGVERGYDRGYDRGPPPRIYDRMPERGPPRDPFPPRDGGKGGGHKGGVGTKLYVGNLPSDITTDAIDMVFSTYGRILDIHIMNARAKNGQSCCFVIYENAAEAKTCMSAMQQGYEIRPGEGDIFVKYADGSKPSGGRPLERPRPY